MKSKFTLALAASIVALTLAAFPHHAAAQNAFAARTQTSALTLPQGSIGTVNAITLPNAGTYLITGQENLLASPTTAVTPVLCYTTNQAGSATELPTGPYSMTTIPSGGGYVTLPLNGYYTVTGPTAVYLVCRYFGVEAVSTWYGTLTATQVK
ncbi:MAG TPA: hypothetical protein VK716_11310 [Terracidiphilus sp.]|nr:hypothetical protein [Terracidiphilus sp.]